MGAAPLGREYELLEGLRDHGGRGTPGVGRVRLIRRDFFATPHRYLNATWQRAAGPATVLTGSKPPAEGRPAFG